ncbi:glutamate ligase domain-containing protein [Sphingomonas sp. SUN039]|uniref:glutamate ligase domain-containing protein n=1 Tax=Sphingomonas sp. SUN039 TaxID=2937787 RepID=UPI0021643179|nr:Mur ligase domain-containing protein [Sphingomonas sp. SUN039]UVO54969.1 Mur ligase family protein [Sphingomonas sp. SUN039]
MGEYTGKTYFFVGIGGSGMMPLAEIVATQGARVAGSDRSLDQGRLGAKFAGLAARGIGLHAQDGSGIVSAEQIVVASAAIEATVPDIVRATELGCARMTRAELLAELFNAAPVSIAVGGTSGKSTVTGMIGWILDQAGRDPTIMNGAIMKNYGTGARVGGGPVFVSEVDESDGSIALYRPTVAVLNNVAVDHKSMEELRALFLDFLHASSRFALNRDNSEAYGLLFPEATRGFDERRPGVRSGESLETSGTFGFGGRPDWHGAEVTELAEGIEFTATYNDESARVVLAVPGRHNASNALAAIAATKIIGIPLAESAKALATFTGLKRRMDVVGTVNSITVIDDFGHNPDKIAATLSALHAFPGRLLVFFQPHGYGPLKQMGRELAYAFRENLGDGDRLIVSDPAYFGGTVDRTTGSETLVDAIGVQAEHIASRDACGGRLLAIAQPGDRIVIMGARDDTLSDFAAGLLASLASA